MSEFTAIAGAAQAPDPYENVPIELKAIRNWVCWRWEERDGRRTKVLYRPGHTTSRASSTDPATWAPFDEALSGRDRNPNWIDGIGSVFAKDLGLVGIDLDRSLNPDGTVKEWARPWVERLLPSYAEVSPSGTGLKFWAVGVKPGTRCAKRGLGPDGDGAVEIYDSGRFFTVTGKIYPGATSRLLDRTGAVATIYHEVWPEPEEGPQDAQEAPGNVGGLEDDEILDRARRSAKGDAFKALFDDGDLMIHEDRNVSDLALVGSLAFWTGGDPEIIDRLFRRSKLMRPKWDERRGAQTYGGRTIEKALEGRTEFYSPRMEAEPGDESSPDEDGDDVMTPDNPDRLAREVLKRETLLRYWNADFWRWNGHRYAPVPPVEFDASVSATCREYLVAEARKAVKLWEANGGKTLAGKPAPRPVAKPVTENLVANVVAAIRARVMVPTSLIREQPAWFSGEGTWPAASVLPMANGLIHLPSMFAPGQASILEPTPDFFNAWSLPYAFHAKPPRPDRWLKFLDDVWPGDPESIRALQEWFGLLLTPDTSHQKVLMVIGDKRCGKGTIMRVLRAMIGAENTASPSLSSLGGSFGLESLLNKPVAIIGDARLSGRADVAVIVERLLGISGEDAVEVSRKHRPAVATVLPTRFVIVSNVMPRLTDAGVALASRMILLNLTQSFYGREDPRLTEKLIEELPSILLWAIQGWKRLRDQGGLTQPASCADMVEELEDLASPVQAFVKDRLVIGPGLSSPIPQLYDAWRVWCQDTGQSFTGNEQSFGKDLRAAIPSVKSHQKRVGGRRVRVYEGVGLVGLARDTPRDGETHSGLLA